MASASAALSVNVSASRGMEAKSAATDVAEQPFGRVLAQEVSRQGGEQQAGESAVAESAQVTSDPSAETEGDDASAVVAQTSQDAAAMPWLLMVQQVVQPAQASPLAQALAEGVGLEKGKTGEGGGVVQGQGASVTSPLVAAQTAASGQVESTGELAGVALAGNGGQGKTLTGALTANSATEAGKALPQDMSGSQEMTPFAGMLASRLEGESNTAGARDGSEIPSWQAVGQSALRQFEAGVEQTKPAAQHVVAEPVGDSRWGDAVAQRVSMMLGRQEQQVEMQLNPPHLGPMEVRLTLGQEQASVVFASQHAAVREALAAATPKLTALLADQGIQLVNVQVASDSLHQQAQEQSRQQQASSFSGEGQGQRNGRSYENELSAPYWRGDVTVPVARSGVSLYV